MLWIFFNFGLIFREWVYMLFKRGKTCIKTNGFITKISQYRVQPDKDVLLHRYCTLFRQCRWLVLSETLRQYMVSNYPTVRYSPQRKHTFACLRTTLISKGKSKNLLKKTSGSKINYEKSKGLFIGRLKEKRPRLTNISWISDNIKTLGIFHEYNIDTDDIWKNINQMKSCTQV